MALDQSQASFQEEPSQLFEADALTPPGRAQEASSPRGRAQEASPPSKFPEDLRKKLNPKSQADLDARALIPGATTSAAVFKAMWAASATQYSSFDKSKHGLPPADMSDILLDTQSKVDRVKNAFKDWERWQVMLGVAALHLYTKRLLDISMRDIPTSYRLIRYDISNGVRSRCQEIASPPPGCRCGGSLRII